MKRASVVHLVLTVGILSFSFASLPADEYDTAVCKAYTERVSQEECLSNIDKDEPAKAIKRPHKSPQMSPQPQMPPAVARSRSDKNSTKISGEIEITAFAARKYPHDSRMQDYIYEQQMAAYNHLLTVNDSEVKRFARRKYPDDYSMQLYIYDQQLSAKRYMSSVTNSSAKGTAVIKYPDDYSMQKYFYDRLYH